jgi:hypothetical protein
MDCAREDLEEEEWPTKPDDCEHEHLEEEWLTKTDDYGERYNDIFYQCKGCGMEWGYKLDDTCGHERFFEVIRNVCDVLYCGHCDKIHLPRRIYEGIYE